MLIDLLAVIGALVSILFAYSFVLIALKPSNAFLVGLNLATVAFLILIIFHLNI